MGTLGGKVLINYPQLIKLNGRAQKLRFTSGKCQNNAYSTKKKHAKFAPKKPSRKDPKVYRQINAQIGAPDWARKASRSLDGH